MDIIPLLSAGLVVVVLAVLYLAFQMYRAGRYPGSLSELAEEAKAAETWAHMAVAAAQQLFESDQIDKGHRYEHADRFLAETLPNLDAGQRRMLIEGAVFSMRQLRERGIIPPSYGLPNADEDHTHST